jgi:hypothetical protein
MREAHILFLDQFLLYALRLSGPGQILVADSNRRRSFRKLSMCESSLNFIAMVAKNKTKSKAKA